MKVKVAVLLWSCLMWTPHALAGPYIDPMSKVPTAFKQRIINGEVSEVNAHPHQVSLQFYFLGDWYHICGGSVIGTEFVVTAAHCVDYRNKDLYRVVINDHNISDGFVGQEQALGLSMIYAHEDYTFLDQYEYLYPHDVAVLKLDGAVEDSGTIIEMASSESEENFEGADCVISGWGTTELEPFPDELMEANTTVISEEECNEYFGPNIFQGHVCVFLGNDTETGTGACNGDSGGPLVCNGKLVGVTSWGVRGCRNEDGSFVPSVYVRVSYYYGWIRTQMQRFSPGRG